MPTVQLATKSGAYIKVPFVVYSDGGIANEPNVAAAVVKALVSTKHGVPLSEVTVRRHEVAVVALMPALVMDTDRFIEDTKRVLREIVVKARDAALDELR